MEAQLSVAAIVPCYNGARYLPYSIESLLKQTRLPSRIILIDDGSTDETRTIIQRYVEENSFVEGIFHDENRGRAVVINELLGNINETYVVLQDSDDFAHSSRIERQVAFMDAHPTINCSSSFIRYIDAKGDPIGKGQLDLLTCEKFHSYLSSKDPFGLFCPAVIIRSLVFNNEDLRFRGTFWPADDIDLWNRIAESGHLILAQPEYLVDYRIHGSSAVTTSFRRTREKFEFVRACLRARRSGQMEPDWETFQSWRKARPTHVKINDWRKSMAKGLYRKGGFCRGEGKLLHMAFALLLATCLQPGYVLRRLWKQVI